MNRSDVSPPGREEQVRALKTAKGVDNPFAVAWASYNKSDNPASEIPGAQPRMTGHMGTPYTYGQKRGEEPARAKGDDDDDRAAHHGDDDDDDALRAALGDDDDMLEGEMCDDPACNDATHGHAVRAHEPLGDDDDDLFTDPDQDGDVHGIAASEHGETNRDEGHTARDAGRTKEVRSISGNPHGTKGEAAEENKAMFAHMREQGYIDESSPLPDWDKDPAVARAINYGKAQSAPANPAVAAHAALGGSGGKVRPVAVSGQEQLNDARRR